MKRIIFTTMVLCFTSGLFAQKDTTFYKHEVRASAGDALTSWLWIKGDFCYVNLSVSYLYRPVKWLWVGGSFVNYIGERSEYNWREYDEYGHFQDFSKSKLKYCAAIAHEIRFSYLNRESFILYSALSGGIIIEDGYDSMYQKYPKVLPYFHITYFGFSCNFGKDNKIFFGSEIGAGCKNFVQIHGGYRF